MKKLISAKEIEELIIAGKNAIYVDGTEIITPAARELAINNSIEFKDFSESKKSETKTNEVKENVNMNGFDNETICNFFKILNDKGMLQQLLESLKPQNNLFDSESHENGLKVVKGNTVKMDVFDTGNPDARVYFQELVSKEESKMSAGFLVIDHSKFEWELTYEEIDYVIEGTLTVEIDGKTYTAHAGDILFVPSNSKVVWGSPDKARVFYATYPANWADLL